MEVGDRIKVQWAGKVVPATVTRVYKNGKVGIELHDAMWTMGRNGSLTKPTRIKVESWQVLI